MNGMYVVKTNKEADLRLGSLPALPYSRTIVSLEKEIHNNTKPKVTTNLYTLCSPVLLKDNVKLISTK